MGRTIDQFYKQNNNNNYYNINYYYTNTNTNTNTNNNTNNNTNTNTNAKRTSEGAYIGTNCDCRIYSVKLFDGNYH